MRTDYETRAEEIATRLSLKLIVEGPYPDCPPWENGKGHVHGYRWRIELRKEHMHKTCPGHPCGTGCDHASSISFDYWNSLRDKEEDRSPSTYDVLACVASDATMPTDPDEVADELGPMKPSQAIRTAEHARMLQAFFSPKEIEALQEIS